MIFERSHSVRVALFQIAVLLSKRHQRLIYVMIVEILNSLFGRTVKPLEREAKAITPLDKAKSDKKRVVSGDNKYKKDNEALKVFYSLEEGTAININLQELLTIAPRNRPRIEAYQGLRGYLLENYRVNLNINSRKTRAYE